MSSESNTQDWSKPAAMAIPKGVLPGQGRAGALWAHLSKDTSMLRLLDPREDNPRAREIFYKYAKSIEETIAAQPDALAVLQLHYLRWVRGRLLHVSGIFDTDFDKYTEDAVTLFGITGLRTVFENLEGFPIEWQTNPAALCSLRRGSCMTSSNDGQSRSAGN